MSYSPYQKLIVWQHLYKAVSAKLCINPTSFRLFFHGKYLTDPHDNLPKDIKLDTVYCIFLLQGGVKPKCDTVHPGRKCTECARCHTASTRRWFHTYDEMPEYLYWFKNTFGLMECDCICSA